MNIITQDSYLKNNDESIAQQDKAQDTLDI